MLIESDSALTRHLDTRREIDVFAFDLFDTLVGRLLPPEYVKVLTGAYLRRRWLADRPSLSTADLYRQRRDVEDQLKAHSRAAGDDAEYAHAEAIRRLLATLGLTTPAIADEVIRFELELEASVLFTHAPVAAAIRDLHARGRRVILISDNYLSVDQIRTLLAPTGLLPCFDAIHVSSTTRRRKDTGRLFEHVLKTLGLPAHHLLHVGDNPHSDDAVPRRLGMPTLLIEFPGEAARRRALDDLLPVDPPCDPDPERLARALALTVQARCRSRPRAAVEMAIALTAPLSAYIDALIERARTLGVPTVYFLAREGHLLRTLFDRACGGTIASAYVHASRVSTHMLAIPELTRDALERAFISFDSHEVWSVSARQLLAFFTIGQPACLDVVREYGLPPDRRLDVRSPVNRDLLARPLLDRRLRTAYTAARAERLAVFGDYLRQLGLPQSGTILMADIGWAGSMQTFIADVLRERGGTPAVHGYYFGFDQVAEGRKGVERARPDLVKDAWICQRTPEDEEARLIVSRIILELVAMAPHGTTGSYRRNGDRVTPECVWLPGEERQFTERILPIQQALQESIALTGAFRRLLPLLVPAADLHRATVRALAQFLGHPPRAVARYFIPCALFDNHFGTCRRLAFGPGMWWGEAVGALGFVAWPWRAQHVLLRVAPHVREGARRLAQCLTTFGPWATLRQLAHRLIRGRFVLGTDFAITAQYRFQRAACPPPPPTCRRVLYLLTDGTDVAAVHQALTHLALDADGGADLLYHAGRDQYNLARVRDHLDITEEALTPGEAGACLAASEYVVVTHAAVRFDADFLRHLQVAFARTPPPDLVYTDHDTFRHGQYTRPRLKPDWSAEYFLEHDYIGRVVALRHDSLGAAPLETLAQLAHQGVYATLLGMMSAWRHVAHVPAVLYHAPFDAGTAPEDVRRRAASALYGDVNTTGGRVTPALHKPLPVSIIIPFRNRQAYLERCVTSIERLSAYRNYELLLVDNQSDEPAMLAYLATLRGKDHIRVVPYDAPFNYSRLNNAAVAQARHPVILLLNNDTEVLAPGWLDAMLAHAQRPEVGGVGAKLLYPDRTVQHAGVVFDFDQAYPAGHIFHRAPAGDAGYERRLQTTQCYSAVTAACFMLRREVFDAVGGFDPGFEVAYNDLDLCCRILEKGYRILWSPDATLLHHENASRGNPLESEQDRQERDRFRARWRHLFPHGDPCYSRHLLLGGSVRVNR
ncbi:MAG: glycosyltransferase [Lentisphaerae bacterium]|nr:glycosyltransferase [Lentisphaerota bacterium]